MADEKTDAEKAEEIKAAEIKKAEEAKAERTATTEEPKGKDGTTFDPDRAQRALEAAREGERKAKQEAKDAREKAKKYDELTEAQKSDLEKAVSRAEKAEAKASDADAKLRRANLIAAFAKPELGIVAPEDAATLIKGVEFDDEGEPTNLGSPDDENSLIAKFLASKPHLRGKPAKPAAPTTNAGEGGTDRPPDLNASELQAARDAGMSPEEYVIYKGGGSLADLKERGLKVEN